VYVTVPAISQFAPLKQMQEKTEAERHAEIGKHHHIWRMKNTIIPTHQPEKHVENNTAFFHPTEA
jgi:hypothetical protein